MRMCQLQKKRERKMARRKMLRKIKSQCYLKYGPVVGISMFQKFKDDEKLKSDERHGRVKKEVTSNAV